MDTIYEYNDLKKYETIKLDLNNNNLIYNFSNFSKSIDSYSIELKENQKILVFVMEQTSKNFFLEELKEIPDDLNFLK